MPLSSNEIQQFGRTKQAEEAVGNVERQRSGT